MDEWDLLNIELNPTMAQYLELKESIQKLKEHKSKLEKCAKELLRVKKVSK